MIGQTVAHYEILGKLGGGGMGVVYKARDTKLGRVVALKFLPQHLSEDETSRARLVQEARAASALHHDSICTIHEIGESDEGQVYIAMAFYEGETLKSVIESGIDSVDQALGIVAQIADGLLAAHEQGVVHRDIKPANIMITDRGKVKILDFGLAKLASSGDLTQEGSTLGTVAYMSPEQARGDDVDPASDIWSLGVLLYEMLAGSKPFEGNYDQAIIYAILNEEARPASSVRQDLPDGVSDLVDRCLSKDASDRPTTADLVQTLAPFGAVVVHSSSGRSMAGPEAGPWYHEPWKVGAAFGLFSFASIAVTYAAVMQFGLPDWVLIGAFLLLAAGLPVVLYAGQLERKRADSLGFTERESALARFVTWRNAWYGGLAAFSGLTVISGGFMVLRLLGIGPAATLVTSGVLSESERIILAEFENTTPDSTLAPSVTEALRIDLGQSRVISLMDRAQIEGVLERMNLSRTTLLTLALARDVAERDGVKAIVAGEVGRLGSGYVLTVSVISAADGRTLASGRETAADDGEVIEAVDRLSAGLREAIGESLTSIRASPPLERVTTASLEALRRYSAAETAAGDRAIVLLREAVELDSTFAMAYRKLAVLLGNNRGDYSERIRAARKAYALRDRLTDVERYQTIAYYHMEVDFDVDAANAAYRAILEQDPDDHIALNNLGIGLQRKGQYAEAAELFARAIDAQPESWPQWTNIVDLLPKLGRWDEAWRLTEEYRPPDGDQAYRAWLRVIMFAQQRRPDSVLAELRPFQEHDALTVRWWVTRFQAGAQYSVGRLASGAEANDRFARISEQREILEWAMLAALDQSFVDVLLLGDRNSARERVDEALAVTSLDSLPVLNRPYSELAILLALVGEPDRARGVLDEYQRLVPEGIRRANPERLRAQGAIALAEGRYAEAVRAYGSYDEECRACALLELAMAYELNSDEDRAVETLERLNEPGNWDSPLTERFTLGPAYRKLGELYENRDQIDLAIDAYSRFTDLWKDCDPSLRPQVEQVEERVDELLRRSAREPVD